MQLAPEPLALAVKDVTDRLGRLGFLGVNLVLHSVEYVGPIIMPVAVVECRS